MKFKYSFTELLTLKEAADQLRELEGGRTPLTRELLEQLVTYFKDMSNRVARSQLFDPNSLFNEYQGHFCGCLGPRDGDPFCPCRMSQLRYSFRYDIALAIEHGYEELKMEK